MSIQFALKEVTPAYVRLDSLQSGQCFVWYYDWGTANPPIMIALAPIGNYPIVTHYATLSDGIVREVSDCDQDEVIPVQVEGYYRANT